MNTYQINKIKNWFHISWQITSKCNLKCRFCEVPERFKSYKEISSRKAINFIKKLKEIDNCRIFWGGGEPLLREDLFYLSNYAKKLGMSIGFVTNGVLLKDKVNDILECGINLVVVSIDGSSPVIHDFHRGVKGAYTNAIEGIKYLLTYRKNISEPSIAIATVATHYNISDLGNIIDLAAKLGVDAIFIRPVQPPSSGKGCDFALSPNEVSMAIDVIQQKKNEYERIIHIQASEVYIQHFRNIGRWNINSNLKCFAGKNFLHITPKGEVYPCWQFDTCTAKYNIENLKADKEWLTKRFREYIIEMKKIGFNPCSHCLNFHNHLLNDASNELLDLMEVFL